MPSCCAPNCKNRSSCVNKNRPPGLGPVDKITYHGFPLSRPQMLKRWIVAMRRTRQLTRNHRICSDHFEEQCFDRTGQCVRLRPSAVPTIFTFSEELPVGNVPEKGITCSPLSESAAQPSCHSVTNSTELHAMQSTVPSVAPVPSSTSTLVAADDICIDNGDANTALRYTEQLGQTLLSFRQDGYLCDTTLIVRDGRLKAHSAVLAAASPTLRLSLTASEKPREHVIILPLLDLLVAEVAVRFAYTGRLVVPKQHVSVDNMKRVFFALSALGLKVDSCFKASIPKGRKRATPGDTDCAETIETIEDVVDRCQQNETTCGEDLAPPDEINIPSSKRQGVVTITNEPMNPECGSVVLENGSELRNICCDDHNYYIPNSLGDDTRHENVAAEIHEAVQESAQNVRRGFGEKASLELELENVPPPSISKSRHRGIFTNQKMCEHCGKVVLSAYFSKHLRTHSGTFGQSCRCDHCGRQFAAKRYLKVHLKKHSGDRQFVCEVCAASFIQLASLHDHRWSCHRESIDPERDKAPFPCRTCEEAFFSTSLLRKHVRLTHLLNFGAVGLPLRQSILTVPRRPRQIKYVCPDCPEEFGKFAQLSSHVLSAHGSNRPLACKQCCARFRNMQQLRYHGSVHTGDRPYMCSECNACFKYPSKLYVHRACYHGDAAVRYKCQHCNRTFATQCGQLRHEVVHTAVRPFKCAVCDRSFLLADDLKLHKCLHAGDNRFECPFKSCEKAYARSKGLRLHCSKVHEGRLSEQIDDIVSEQSGGTMDVRLNTCV